MMMRYFCFSMILTAALSGCSTPKKIQRSLGFSDTCLDSYQYFKKRIKRESNGLLEFELPYEEVYNELWIEYAKNPLCWLEVLSEDAVVTLFGNPHRRDVGHLNQEVTLVYYIRTKRCDVFDDLGGMDLKCGVLSFIFSKEGKPIGGVFYSL